MCVCIYVYIYGLHTKEGALLIPEEISGTTSNIPKKNLPPPKKNGGGQETQGFHMANHYTKLTNALVYQIKKTNILPILTLSLAP